ncbi:hypothetical protein J7E83_11850 [Arthrobacter sp. ISL-48]|uniref:hypothetical protein n=1 Tax=Arthrobacter sp. ISL-48 TaxID=2819110 RepID=UPI001BE7CA84|nr:hypothetical protein [Arthrobacter sp. ISL-48]MBT2532802.1 hypothetical protein [Arthrobacter sp. ISL-48]
MKGEDPRNIAAFLMRHGWERTGGRDGYDRYRFKDGRSNTEQQSVIVPLDQSWADYDELLGELLLRIEATSPEVGPLMVKELLERSLGDELKFRKDVSTIGGAVAWSAGRDLIWAAENILLAGAKTRLSRRAYYGQANGRFAHRFLDSVLMGQTEIGSYVVTAFAPPHEAFPDRAPKVDAPSIAGLGTYTGREIVESVVGGLESTVEALEHYKTTNSMSGFERGVSSGVSREMVEAVRRMVVDSDGADVTVEWSGEVVASQPLQAKTHLAFEGSAAPVLERAGHTLASLQPAEHVTAVGRLSLVSRPKRGEMGVVRLKVSAGSEASTLQIRLSEESFEVAAAAIAHEEEVQVTGRQERDGNRYWLYDADLDVVPAALNDVGQLF